MDKSKKDIVLFVHGAWHGAWCWEKHFTKLFEDRGYETHTFDLPKHDVSGKVKGINMLSMNDYVEALKREVVKLDRSPIIIGHSMGGLVVQKYLETATCKKAILMASVPPAGVLRTTFNFLKKAYAYPALLTMDLYQLVDTPQKAKWAFFSDALPEQAVKEYTDHLCAESYRAFVEMLYPNIKVNNHLKIPLLVIGGENDNIFTVKENKSTAEKYNADLIIVDDIAHDMMLDVNHEQVSDHIINWIEKVPVT